MEVAVVDVVGLATVNGIVTVDVSNGVDTVEDELVIIPLLPIFVSTMSFIFKEGLLLLLFAAPPPVDVGAAEELFVFEDDEVEELFLEELFLLDADEAPAEVDECDISALALDDEAAEAAEEL